MLNYVVIEFRQSDLAGKVGKGFLTICCRRGVTCPFCIAIGQVAGTPPNSEYETDGLDPATMTSP